MALQLSLHICQSTNCKQLKISETTGIYDVNTNPGGWDGGPNIPLSANVTNAFIVITAPDGVIYSFDRTTVGSPTFPFPDPTGLLELPFEYTNAGIVVAATNTATPISFPDGFYAVTYEIEFLNNGAKQSSFTNQSILLTCQARCCVDKLFHAASQTKECADCDNNLLNKALEAEAYLKSAEYAAACGKVEMAKKNLAKVQWICNTYKCSNC